MFETVWIGCLIIFCGRIVDVSLNTMRTILMVKERTAQAAIVGIMEVTVWFFVVRNAITADLGLFAGLAYAGGFAVGTIVGGRIAKRFISGNVVLQIVINKNDEMVQTIRNAGFGVSVVDVKESDYGAGKYMLFCDIDKNRLDELKHIVHEYEESAFIMVSETKHVFNGFIK